MTDFGFSLSRSSTVELDKLDNELFERLCRLDPGARTCIACGSCGASCPSARFSGMSVRKILLALQRGVDVKPMLRGCMLCGKCSMVCPRGINTRRLLLEICRIYD